MRAKTMFAILFIVGGLACASTTSRDGKKVSSSRDFLSTEEIRNSGAANAYDLIKNLRPHWLRNRGRKSFRYEETASSPVVYINEGRHGDLNSLTGITIQNISKVQFLNASDATTRFGLNHVAGAILITTI